VLLLRDLPKRRPEQGAFSSIVQERADGVLVLSTPLFMGGAKELAELALTHKLPTRYKAGPRFETR
jgi:hypothetical protein